MKHFYLLGALVIISACQNRSGPVESKETTIDVGSALSAKTKSSVTEYSVCMRVLVSEGKSNGSAEEECAGAIMASTESVADDIRAKYPKLDVKRVEALAEKYVDENLARDEAKPHAPNP